MKNDVFINRILYVSFCLFGLYHAIFKNDFSEAAIFLGIALAFDPFDQTITWKERPILQKLILIVQVCFVFLFLLVGILH